MQVTRTMEGGSSVDRMLQPVISQLRSTLVRVTFNCSPCNTTPPQQQQQPSQELNVHQIVHQQQNNIGRRVDAAAAAVAGGQQIQRNESLHYQHNDVNQTIDLNDDTLESHAHEIRTGDTNDNVSQPLATAEATASSQAAETLEASDDMVNRPGSLDYYSATIHVQKPPIVNIPQDQEQNVHCTTQQQQQQQQHNMSVGSVVTLETSKRPCNIVALAYKLATVHAFLIHAFQPAELDRLSSSACIENCKNTKIRSKNMSYVDLLTNIATGDRASMSLVCELMLAKWESVIGRSDGLPKKRNFWHRFRKRVVDPAAFFDTSPLANVGSSNIGHRQQKQTYADESTQSNKPCEIITHSLHAVRLLLGTNVAAGVRQSINQTSTVEECEVGPGTGKAQKQQHQQHQQVCYHDLSIRNLGRKVKRLLSSVVKPVPNHDGSALGSTDGIANAGVDSPESVPAGCSHFQRVCCVVGCDVSESSAILFAIGQLLQPLLMDMCEGHTNVSERDSFGRFKRTNNQQEISPTTCSEEQDTNNSGNNTNRKRRKRNEVSVDGDGDCDGDGNGTSAVCELHSNNNADAVNEHGDHSAIVGIHAVADAGVVIDGNSGRGRDIDLNEVIGISHDNQDDGVPIEAIQHQQLPQHDQGGHEETFQHQHQQQQQHQQHQHQHYEQHQPHQQHQQQNEVEHELQQQQHHEPAHHHHHQQQQYQQQQQFHHRQIHHDQQTQQTLEQQQQPGERNHNHSHEETQSHAGQHQQQHQHYQHQQQYSHHQNHSPLHLIPVTEQQQNRNTAGTATTHTIHAHMRTQTSSSASVSDSASASAAALPTVAKAAVSGSKSTMPNGDAATATLAGTFASAGLTEATTPQEVFGGRVPALLRVLLFSLCCTRNDETILATAAAAATSASTSDTRVSMANQATVECNVNSNVDINSATCYNKCEVDVARRMGCKVEHMSVAALALLSARYCNAKQRVAIPLRVELLSSLSSSAAALLSLGGDARGTAPHSNNMKNNNEITYNSKDVSNNVSNNNNSNNSSKGVNVDSISSNNNNSSSIGKNNNLNINNIGGTQDHHHHFQHQRNEHLQLAFALFD